MIDTEFLAQYTYIRSSYFGMLDEINAQRGCVPMKYMIVLARNTSISRGNKDDGIFDYFAEEWSKLHPEAFDDSNR